MTDEHDRADVRDVLLLLALFVAAALVMFVTIVEPWTAVRTCPPDQTGSCSPTD